MRALFGGSEADFAAHDPASAAGPAGLPAARRLVRLGHGDGSPRRDTTRLAAEARSAGVTVQEFSGPGGHDFGFVGHALADALPWLDDHLQVPPVG